MTDALQDRVDAIERNDVPAAENVARDIVAELGALPGTTMHYLCMLQDDPDTLMDRLVDLPVADSAHAI